MPLSLNSHLNVCFVLKDPVLEGKLEEAMIASQSSDHGTICSCGVIYEQNIGHRKYAQNWGKS